MTGAIVGVEISWKLAFGQNLVGTSHTYVYMGMQVVFLSHQLKRDLTRNVTLNSFKKIYTSSTLSFTLPLTKSK